MRKKQHSYFIKCFIKRKNIADLVEALQAVDPKSSNSEANVSSISDNNGGRIELDKDLTNSNVIKK